MAPLNWKSLAETWRMNVEGDNILICLDNKVKICPMRNVSGSYLDPSLFQGEQLISLSELQICSKCCLIKL